MDVAQCDKAIKGSSIQLKKHTGKHALLTMLFLISIVALVFSFGYLAYISNATREQTLEKKFESDFLTLPVNEVSEVNKAIESQDYASLNGIEVSSLFSQPSFFAQYIVKIDDKDVAVHQLGKIYALNPGLTKVYIYTLDEKSILVEFDVAVPDAQGNVYYDVVFSVSSNEQMTFKVVTGKSLSQSGISLPALPQLPGYNVTGWEVNGKLLDLNAVVSANLVVVPQLVPISVELTKNLVEVECLYGTEFELNIKPYIVDTDKQRFTFAINDYSDPDFGVSVDNGIFTVSKKFMKSLESTENIWNFIIKITDSANGLTSELNIHFGVTPLTVNVSFNNSDALTYNGKAQTLNAQISGVLQEDIDLVTPVIGYKKQANMDYEEYFVHAGTYTATLLSLNGAKKDCYIIQEDIITKQISVAPLPVQAVFLDDAQQPVAQLKYSYTTKVVLVDATVSGLLTGDVCGVIESYSGVIKNVGTYSVWAEALDNPDYYLTQTLQCEVIIEPAGLNVECPDMSKTYGESDDLLFYSFGVHYMFESEKVDISAALNKYVVRTEGEMPGSYTITLDIQLNTVIEEEVLSNYYITKVTPGILTIVKRSAWVAVYNNPSKVYDGTPYFYIQVGNIQQQGVGSGILDSDYDAEVVSEIVWEITVYSEDYSEAVKPGVYKHLTINVYEYEAWTSKYEFVLITAPRATINKFVVEHGDYMQGLYVIPKEIKELEANYTEDATLAVADLYIAGFGLAEVIYYEAKYDFGEYAASKTIPIGEYPVYVKLILSDYVYECLDFQFAEDEIASCSDGVISLILYGEILESEEEQE
jgi:hypothetical protein